MVVLLVAVLAFAGNARLAADPPSPSVTINLGDRQSSGTPTREGFNHTGGGNIDVAQPAPDTLVITMTGVAVAGAHPCRASRASLSFDLSQEFEVTFEKSDVKKAKLTIEGRLIGLLRSHAKGGGSADICAPGRAAVVSGSSELIVLDFPGRIVAGGENLSVNDRKGPISVTLNQGKYTLNQVFGVEAAHPKCVLPCKAASAEFAPDPALDPLWISYWEPFHGANKKDFGFQVTLKVSADNRPYQEKPKP
jgi:hypothetical protein